MKIWKGIETVQLEGTYPFLDEIWQRRNFEPMEFLLKKKIFNRFCSWRNRCDVLIISFIIHLQFEKMGPRKQGKTENGEHQSPIYLKHVSNFKASLRRRDSQRFLRTKVRHTGKTTDKAFVVLWFRRKTIYCTFLFHSLCGVLSHSDIPLFTIILMTSLVKQRMPVCR